MCSLCSTDSKFIALSFEQIKPTCLPDSISNFSTSIDGGWWIFVLNVLSLSRHIRNLLWFLIHIFELYDSDRDNGAKTTSTKKKRKKSPYRIPCHLPCFISNCWLRHWYTPNMHTIYCAMHLCVCVFKFRNTGHKCYFIYNFHERNFMAAH